MSFKQADETSFFCYRALEKNTNKELSDSCRRFLVAKVTSEIDRIKLEAEETTKQMDEFMKLLFGKFWDKIKNRSDQVDKTKLQEGIYKKFAQEASEPLQNKLNKMKHQSTKEGIRKIFNTLPPWVWNKLLED